ncbi:MAG: hypothetical protein V1863_00920 [Candidatus Omnitrophota bacterium]
MAEGSKRAIQPVAIFKDGALAWARRFIPVTIISCASVLITSLLYLYPVPSSWALSLGPAMAKLAAAFYFLVFFCVVAVTSLLSLMILVFYDASIPGRFSFAVACREALKRLAGFLKSYALIAVFFFGLSNLGQYVYLAGRYFYSPQIVGQPLWLKLGVLLAASTFFVTCLIAACWYTFFFSLAPLVGGYEGTGLWESLRQSRRRIRGNALRYLGVMLMPILCYMGIGLVLFRAAIKTGCQNNILILIDPAVSAVLGPLILAVWFVCYRELSATTGAAV